MKNESGWQPAVFKVLVKPDKVEEKTAGGLFIPQQTQEKDKFAGEEGTIVDFAPTAFEDPNWLEKPKIGDKVQYKKYAGAWFKSPDGEEYKVLQDEEILIFRSE